MHARAPLLMRLGLAGACAFGVTLSSVSALADEPERVIMYDPNAYPPSGARPRLIIGGLASTAVWYGATAGVSYLWPDAPGAEDLRIPVAGPWLALGDTGCPEGEPDCSAAWVVFRAVMTTLSGIGQVGGLYIALEGAFLPSGPATAPATGTEPARERRAPASTGLSVTPAPIMAGRDGLGLGLVGHF